MNTMTMRPVPDGRGGYRHIPTPFVPTTPGKRARKRPVPDPIKTNGESAAEQLRLLIERKERLLEEKQGIADDISDLDGEMKSRGYSVKAINEIIAKRKKDPDALQEHQAIVETYECSLGITL